MKLCVDTALIEAAQALEPVIREHADEAEQKRRLSRPVVEALAAAGLFRLYAPKSLGGLEVDPVTCARLVEVVSGFDSAAGWALMAANSIALFCARLPDDGVEEVYAAGASTVLATAYHPPMQAVRVEGGYRFSGRSALASNGHEARWLTLFAQVAGEDGANAGDAAPQFIGGIFLAEECEILDTWHSTGMRGTDSNDIALHDAFVPTRRTFPVTPEYERGRHYQGPLYRMPWAGADSSTWVAVCLPIARAAIDEVCALAARKKPGVSVVTLRERGVTQAKIGLAQAALQSARTWLYDTLTDAWARTLAGEESTLVQKGEDLPSLRARDADGGEGRRPDV
jgi:alkylation response protein AidB-like acyl-CoA dehydrogenase